MKKINPVYWYMLFAAIAIYVIGVCMMQTDLYKKVGILEHDAMHVTLDREAQAAGRPEHTWHE